MKKNILLGAAIIAGGLLLSQKINPASAATDKPLLVYDWAGYDDPTFYKPYMDAYKKKPTFVFFSSEDEALAKIKAGFRVDLAHPCIYNMRRWREAGVIQPIDVSKLKNYKDLNKKYSESKDYKTPDGKVWAIPFDTGRTTLVYNADKVSAADVKSLQVFTNPKYKGKVSVPGDSVSDWFMLGFLATGGRDRNTITGPTDPQYTKAIDFLRKVHNNQKNYWNDSGALAASMKTGETLIAWAWDETPARLQAEGINIKTVRNTKEPYYGFVCGYVWTKDSKADPKKVYDFLDAVSAESSVEPLLQFGYAHANSKALVKLPANVLKAANYDEFDKYANRVVLSSSMSEQLNKMLNDDYNKIKVGN
ncbi:MAG: ABC transporter substrate-binding protein [Hydrotalea sp.]|nr:ABC transporter substrate-binding protein [Hydrotalea sp.]